MKNSGASHIETLKIEQWKLNLAKNYNNPNHANELLHTYIPETIASENLNCGEIRHIVLHKCLSTCQGNGNSCSISTPFVVAIPKIPQLKIFHAFSLPRMPQTVKACNLRLHTKTEKEKAKTLKAKFPT